MADGGELRTDLNVRYYRVSWWKVGSGNPYLPLTNTQLRHYIHKVGTSFPIDPYVLGPQTVNGTPNLLEMPPALPPLGQWVPPICAIPAVCRTRLCRAWPITSNRRCG
jgi:hypothetical protein